MGKLLDS